MISWLRSWAATLRIKFFERELYRELTRPLDLGDFGEVGPPGDDSARWSPSEGWL